MMAGQSGYTIIKTPRLSERTSIGLGGKAIAEIRFFENSALEFLPGLLSRLGGHACILGEGTNVIAADGPLPLVLISWADKKTAPEIIGEKDGTVLVRVSAGYRLPALLRYAAAKGLSGLEGLCGIPGSVGGAVAMNAGTRNTEIGALVRSVSLFSPVLGMVERHAADFDFAYRSCMLRNYSQWFLITRVTLALCRGVSQNIRATLRANYLKKRALQPLAVKSAGCVFKNPAPEASAGQLLDLAGCKGLALGDMRFSPLHANFLENIGGGGFAEAVELMDMGMEKVQNLYGYRLEKEVLLWR